MISTTRSCVSFFHEQVPEVRLHPLRRWKRLASSQCTSQHHPPRLEPRFRKKEVYSLTDAPSVRGQSATAAPSESWATNTHWPL
jgi:hypothetical protein